MTIKKSVRLSDLTIDQCASLADRGEINWSGSLNQIAERYALFCEFNLPKITHFEKLAICETYKGYWFDNNIELELRAMDRNLSWAVQHDQDFDKLLKQGGSPKDEFLKRAKAWTMPERLAVVAMINHFWNNNGQIAEVTPE